MLRIVGRVLLPLVSMLIVLTPAHAQTESPVAAKAASIPAACSTLHTTARSLASATKTKAQTYCKQARRYSYFVHHWYSKSNRWTLYLSPENRKLKCSRLQVLNRLVGPEALCITARQNVRIHSRKLVKLSRKISALLPAIRGYSSSLPYRHFTSCKDAVKYIFAGRADEARAEMVVHRESTDRPGAANGTHLGCAEESEGMRSAHLHGPWNDAFWNVLAMRDVVDDPSYGWCHWDLVNYCLPGGEF